MARKRKGRDVCGWLCLDKPVGLGSTKAVSEVRWLFGSAKAGHAGTLDPLASGMLPIALGEATKTVPYVMEGRKVYRFTVRWGAETDSDDADGTVTRQSDRRPAREEIVAAIPAFTGTLMQVPPAFSAIRIDGERAYDLARDGEAVTLEPRPVEVHRLSLTDLPDPDTAVFEAECGKGTYVRAIARDMGRALGTAGHVVALRRLVVGPFDEADMVTIEALRAAREAEGPEACDAFLRPVELAVGDLPQLSFAGHDAERLGRGQSVLLRGRDAPLWSGPAAALSAGRLIAIGEVASGEFCPRRVFRPG
jgi:tRNA pseudouridine55 synthase